MSNPMSVNRSTIVILLSGAAVAALCAFGLQRTPLAHAQTGKLVANKLTPFTPRVISMTSADDLASLEKMDQATTDLVKFVEPGVVQIFSQSGVKHDLMGNMLPSIDGEGSGVVYR